MKPPITAFCAFESLPRPLLFRRPFRTLAAFSLADVASTLENAENFAKSGFHVFGSISYEAAPAFDKKAHVKTGASDSPLVFFHVYRKEDAEEVDFLPEDELSDFEVGEFEPSVSYDEYAAAIEAIREEIRQGNTYQANFTMRLRADFTGNPLSLLKRLLKAQNCGYGAYLDSGRYKILSASPERFFSWDTAAGVIETRPMKGTAPRGLDVESDLRNRDVLKSTPKERAENLMIVDLLRNDLSRLAISGSVSVPSLFKVEKFPTVWQMTSTVTCRTVPELGLLSVFRALFPCGSITGAPKISTMRIIADLECSPRGVYCGALVYLSPGMKRAEASVPIRTAIVDSVAGRIEYGVGGGITWDSTPRGEWDECFAKSRVLRQACDPGHEIAPKEFELLETIRMEADGSVRFLEGHLERVLSTADYFDVPLSRESILSALNNLEPKPNGLRIRLTIASNGKVATTTATLPSPFVGPQRCVIAKSAIDLRDVFYYHKTTRRGMYEKARGLSDPEHAYFDTLLYNERNELTEFTIGNAVVELPLDSGEVELGEGNQNSADVIGDSTDDNTDRPAGMPVPKPGHGLFTPPVACGLLPGVFRSSLLKAGVVKERIVSLDEVKDRRGRVWLVNAVRGFVEVEVDGLD